MTVWPATVAGHPKRIVPGGRCEACPPSAHLVRAYTWVAYGGRRLCAHDAGQAARQRGVPAHAERGASPAA